MVSVTYSCFFYCLFFFGFVFYKPLKMYKKPSVACELYKKQLRADCSQLAIFATSHNCPSALGISGVSLFLSPSKKPGPVHCDLSHTAVFSACSRSLVGWAIGKGYGRHGGAGLYTVLPCVHGAVHAPCAAPLLFPTTSASSARS